MASKFAGLTGAFPVPIVDHDTDEVVLGYRYIDAFHASATKTRVETKSKVYPFNLSFQTVGSLCRFYFWVVQGGDISKPIPATHLTILKSLVCEIRGVHNALSESPRPGLPSALFSLYAKHDDACIGVCSANMKEADAKAVVPVVKPHVPLKNKFTVVPNGHTTSAITDGEMMSANWMSSIHDVVGKNGIYSIDADSGTILLSEGKGSGYRTPNSTAMKQFECSGQLYGNVAVVKANKPQLAILKKSREANVIQTTTGGPKKARSAPKPKAKAKATPKVKPGKESVQPASPMQID